MTADVVIPIRADDKTAQAFAKVEKRIKGVGKSVDKAGAAMRRSAASAGALGSKLKGIVTGFAGFAALRGAVKTIADFEEQIATLRGVTQASGDMMGAMSKRARQLGATTRFSGAQAAEGMVLLSRAGLTASQTMGAVGSTLDLATAAGLDLAAASDIAANTMKQFGIDASEAVRVADSLVTVSQKSNTDVTQLGEAMKFAGVTAASLDQNLETTSAALGVLADRGLKATLGGTALRAVMLGLASPSKKAKEAFKAMGLQASDLVLKNNNLAKVMGVLGEKQLDITQASDIFGKRFAAAGVVLSQNADAITKLTKAQQDNAGSAREVAGIMEKTLKGSMLSLWSAVSEGILSLGDAGLTGVLKKVIDTGTDAFRILTGMERDMTKASGAGHMLAKAIRAAGVALGGLLLTKIVFGFASLATGIGKATKALVLFQNVTVVGGILRIAAAVATAVATFWALSEPIDAASARLAGFGQNAHNLSVAIKRIEGSGKLIERGFETGEVETSLIGVSDKLSELLRLRNDLVTGDLKFPSLSRSVRDADKFQENLRSVKAALEGLGIAIPAGLKQQVKDLDEVDAAMQKAAEAQRLMAAAQVKASEASEFGSATAAEAIRVSQEAEVAYRQAARAVEELRDRTSKASVDSDVLKAALEGLEGQMQKLKEATVGPSGSIDDLRKALSGASAEVPEAPRAGPRHRKVVVDPMGGMGESGKGLEIVKKLLIEVGALLHPVTRGLSALQSIWVGMQWDSPGVQRLGDDMSSTSAASRDFERALASLKSVMKGVDGDSENASNALRKLHDAANQVGGGGGGGADDIADEIKRLQRAIDSIDPSNVHNLERTQRILKDFGALGNISSATAKLGKEFRDARDASDRVNQAARELSAAQRDAASEARNLGQASGETLDKMIAAKAEYEAASIELDSYGNVLTDAKARTDLYGGTVDALSQKLKQLMDALRGAADAQKQLNNAQSSGSSGAGRANTSPGKALDDFNNRTRGAFLGSGPQGGGESSFFGGSGGIPSVVVPESSFRSRGGGGGLPGGFQFGDIHIHAETAEGGREAADSLIRELEIRARDASFALEGGTRG